MTLSDASPPDVATASTGGQSYYDGGEVGHVTESVIAHLSTDGALVLTDTAASSSTSSSSDRGEQKTIVWPDFGGDDGSGGGRSVRNRSRVACFATCPDTHSVAFSEHGTTILTVATVSKKNAPEPAVRVVARLNVAGDSGSGGGGCGGGGGGGGGGEGDLGNIVHLAFSRDGRHLLAVSAAPSYTATLFALRGPATNTTTTTLSLIHI